MCARGKYIAYLDDDNVFLPNHLEVLYETITKTQADVVYGDRVYKSIFPNEKRFMGKMSYDFDLNKLNQANYIDTSDIMHTIQAINDIGYWDIFWERKADWFLMLRFGKKGMKIIHVPEIITEYWWGDNNIGTPLK
jgi:glycosyltransferase involved in cell wall biosynthesis